jgi:membrane-bound lytic murein transglycosylase B
VAGCSGAGPEGGPPTSREAVSATSTTARAPARTAGGVPSSAPTTAAPRRAPATTTTASLAAVVARTETAIRDPATPAAQLPELGRAQQRAYRAMARQPALIPAVLRLLPAALRPVAEANARAGSDLRKLSRPGPQLPRWRIGHPAPPAELLAAYHDAEARLGVGWAYLAAVNLVETRFGRIRGDSPAGAKGPMQFLPSTWRRYGGGGDINSTRDAVLAAARLLRANGAPARMAAALYAYNHSDHGSTLQSIPTAGVRLRRVPGTGLVGR